MAHPLKPSDRMASSTDAAVVATTQDRAVEPQFVPHGLDLLFLGRGPENHQNGVPRNEVNKAEYQDGNQPQDRDYGDEAADDVFLHE